MLQQNSLLGRVLPESELDSDLTVQYALGGG